MYAKVAMFEKKREVEKCFIFQLLKILQCGVFLLFKTNTKLGTLFRHLLFIL